MAVQVNHGVLSTIGNTPLVRLRRVVPDGSAEVHVKIEGVNPTGSMKDRMAVASVDGAEAKGWLQPGGTVVEYTGGSTGTSLALVCAARGYRARLVTSDAFSQEKRDHMASLGAELTIVPSDRRRITEALIKDMIDTAGEISREPGAWWVDQLNNHDAVRGYHALGDEIWQQTEGRVAAFVQSVGTAHSFIGAVEALRRHRADLHAVAVEPAESPILSEGRTGAHQIEGIGIGFVPPLWDPSVPDEIVSIPTVEAKAMARRLAREEGLFAGTSSGANVIAALRVAERLGPGSVVVTLLVDNGAKYLSTDVYQGVSGAARIAPRIRPETALTD